MTSPLEPSSYAHLQAANVTTDPAVLRSLCRHADRAVRQAAATNPATPADGLLWVLAEFYDEVMGNGSMTLALLVNPDLLQQAPFELLVIWSGQPDLPASFLRQFVSDYAVHRTGTFRFDWTIQRNLASNPGIPLDLLESFCTSRTSEVRGGAAGNPALPLPLLEQLARDPEAAVRASVACNPTCPVEVFERLWSDVHVRTELAVSPTLPASLREQLARDPYDCVRQNLAQRDDLSDELGVLLADDPDYLVLRELARNDNLSDKVHERLARNAIPAVRWEIAVRKNLSDEVRERLARDDCSAVRATLAGRVDLPDRLREQLARDPEASVRATVARHPKTSGALLLELSACPEHAVQEALLDNRSVDSSDELFARYVTNRFSVLRERAAWRTSSLAVLTRFASDPEASVRRGVALNPNCSPELLGQLLEQLALDANPVVRHQVAAHASTPMSLLDSLAHDPRPEVRDCAAARLRGEPFVTPTYEPYSNPFRYRD